MKIPLLTRQLLKRDLPAVPPTIESLAAAFQDRLRGLGFSPRLAERVWVASRCLQLNCQQIASMPMRFIGTSAPAWVANPDPAWFPNGIADAVFAAVHSMYAWGDAFLLVTARYANGLPSAWTVLDPAPITIQMRNGLRVYESGGYPLPADDVVQISRNPHGGLRGSSALRAYAAQMWGLLGANETGRSLQGEGAIPPIVLKSQRKLTPDQALAIQTSWMEARARSASGSPAILPPELDLEKVAFSPSDLLLLDAQDFDARVIASAFGVPAFMLNLPLAGGLTYQNPEILFDFWWRTELRPAAGRVTSALTSQMLPRGNSVHFDARETVAPGLKDLHTIWLDALKEGAITVDEYRRGVLQLGPLGDEQAIDELLQPLSAGASPADQPTAEVVALRPQGVMTG